MGIFVIETQLCNTFLLEKNQSLFLDILTLLV